MAVKLAANGISAPLVNHKTGKSNHTSTSADTPTHCTATHNQMLSLEPKLTRYFPTRLLPVAKKLFFTLQHPPYEHRPAFSM